MANENMIQRQLINCLEIEGNEESRSKLINLLTANGMVGNILCFTPLPSRFIEVFKKYIEAEDVADYLTDITEVMRRSVVGYCYLRNRCLPTRLGELAYDWSGWDSAVVGRTVGGWKDIFLGTDDMAGLTEEEFLEKILTNRKPTYTETWNPILGRELYNLFCTYGTWSAQEYISSRNGQDVYDVAISGCDDKDVITFTTDREASGLISRILTQQEAKAVKIKYSYLDDDDIGGFQGWMTFENGKGTDKSDYIPYSYEAFKFAAEFREDPHILECLTPRLCKEGETQTYDFEEEKYFA